MRVNGDVGHARRVYLTDDLGREVTVASIIAMVYRHMAALQTMWELAGGTLVERVR